MTTDDWYVEQQLSTHPDVVNWTTIPADLDEAQARARVARSIDARAESRLARYVIVDTEGVPLGTCGIGAVDGGVEIFYALLPAGRGRGAATAAAAALAGWASACGVDSVSLTTFPDNLASQRVAKRAGFVRNGEQRRTVKGVEVRLLVWSLAG